MFPEGSWVGQNPYLFVTGTRALMHASNFAFSERPTDEEIQALFQIWGKETAFEDNLPGVAAALRLDGQAVPNESILDCLEATRTLEHIPLRSVYGEGSPNGGMLYLATGAVANWMDRRVATAKSDALRGIRFSEVIALASERVCKAGTEVNNPYVVAYRQEYEETPLEHQLLRRILFGYFGDLGKEVAWRGKTYIAGTLEKQVRAMLEKRPEVAQMRICCNTNANATFVALQVRRVIRSVFPSFDSDPGNPQFYFSQDSFPLARTPEQAADTARYQRPLTVFPGLVRLIHELHQL